jgi:decaprenylphospho-beta-D-ribofuranose 2-oxidase
MPSFLSKDLSGWGRFPVENCLVARPEKFRDLPTLVASNEVPSLVARGLGRSYGDVALNSDSGIVLIEKLAHFLGFDEGSGVLHVQGGASFLDILETFVPLGWFLPVAPGTRFITVGGAIACDVHGKNHHIDGTIANYIEEFQLLKADGETITCSKTENSSAFWATVGGLGLTGIITSAKIKLKPIETSHIYSTTTRTQNLDETLAEFEKDAETPYTVAWIDGLASGDSLGRSVVLRGHHASKAQILTHEDSSDPLSYSTTKKGGVPIDLPNFALNPLSVKAFNSFYYGNHPSGEGIVPLEPFFWPLDAVPGWNRIYGTRGFVQYQCIFPFETSREGLRKVLDKIANSGHAAFLGVLKIHGEQNLSPLSFTMAGYSLALDLPATEGVVDFCHQLDEIVVEYGGRNYLAKDSTLEAATFRKMYPRLGEFEAVKRELDPKNRFQSSLSRRLQIGVSA